MAVGLGTYALFWHWAESFDEPFSLIDMFDVTAEMDITVFQICDYPALHRYSDRQLRDIHTAAAERSIRLELGTRGLTPTHLGRHLDIAEILDVRLLRSMIYGAESRPTDDEALTFLDQLGPELTTRGIDLALETYEQISTTRLVRLLTRVGHERIGICLDPANCVASLEYPGQVVDQCAPFVKNVHVKDFQFTRRQDWIGFELIGTPLGHGLLDYSQILEQVRPQVAGVNEIIEHWLPWQGDPYSTRKTEMSWTSQSVHKLRSQR